MTAGVTSRARAALVSVAIAGALAMAGCTSSSGGHGTAAVTSPSVTVDGLPTDTSVPGDTSVPTAATTSGTTTPSRTTTSTGIALPKDTCTGTQLTVQILRGGALPAQEIAVITFTNSSTVTCSMFGFPGVSLRLKGSQVGQPALRSAVTARTVRLLPGEQAHAQITDFSSCEASLSDTARVYPPNLKTFVDKPIELRACRFEVDPVAHS